ncbi:hypothetical protein [Desulfocicer niacini]
MEKILLVSAALIISFCATSYADVDHSEFIEDQCLTGEDTTAWTSQTGATSESATGMAGAATYQ